MENITVDTTIKTTNTFRKCFLLFAAQLMASSIVPAFAEMENTLNNDSNAPIAIWQVIASIESQLPFDQSKIERLLNVKFKAAEPGPFEVLSTAETTSRFLVSESPIALPDGSRIALVDLRLLPERRDKEILVLDIDGRCITRQQVWAEFGKLPTTGAPRGRSLDESTYFSMGRSWGSIRLGFKERQPDCLSSVVFRPAETPLKAK